MQQAIQVTDLRNTINANYSVEYFPDQCPQCHRSVIPVHLTTKGIYIGQDSDPDNLQLVFQCTNLNCQDVFIGLYRKRVGGSLFYLQRTMPRNARSREFPEEIRTLSPSFVKIYEQALEAESNELDQIEGIGLRKALEFLIKDYVIKKHPQEEEKIKKKFLGNCIKDYISDTNVKDCAERASWLGNDEAHYIRKWEDKDIKDLKLLIRLTENWIENALLTEKYRVEMETKAKGKNKA